MSSHPSQRGKSLNHAPKALIFDSSPNGNNAQLRKKFGLQVISSGA